MKITKIKINKFRNLSDIDLEFSPYLNAIAGQNGTSKTALLGLIGHIFTFSAEYKTLAGKKFATQFSEIFRFAYPDYDKAGDHIWETEFDNDKKIIATSYHATRKEVKPTIRIKVGKSKAGSKKINLPVIYLGMGRLFPLALEEDIRGDKSSLTAEEINEFKNLHNEILLMDHDITPKPIVCSKSRKNFYAPNTKEYNHLGNSAGQDNLGQIITALISFKRLQKKIGKKYEGGILLIDEIDASLYPAAQMKLIEKLHTKALELNLQIFFTTHSLEVLQETEKVSGKAFESKTILLDNSYGKIVPRYNLDYKELSQKLCVLGPDAFKELLSKKYVYCEDEEAVDFIKNILSTETKKRIEIFPTKLGESVLKDIAKKKIPDFKKSIIVLDGDTTTGNISNVILLPGKEGPDTMIFRSLKALPANDAFWEKKQGYDKQFCFKNLMSLESATDAEKKRVKVKKWYQEQKKYWGRTGIYAWKVWIQQHEKEVSNFIKKFELLI